MPDFKPGDKIRVVNTETVYVYVGEVGDRLYAIIDHARAYAPANAFSAHDWELAPKPFFEVNKTYVYKDGNYRSHGDGAYRYTIHHVVNMGGKRYATALNGRGHESIWNEEEFLEVEEA